MTNMKAFTYQRAGPLRPRQAARRPLAIKARGQKLLPGRHQFCSTLMKLQVRTKTPSIRATIQTGCAGTRSKEETVRGALAYSGANG